MRNLFVVEGIDGVGKTTILNSLKGLNNNNPNLWFDKEPSKEIKDMMADLNQIQRFLAVMADRMFHLKCNANPKFDDIDFVFDRYEPSTYVYNVCLGGVPFSEFLDWRVNIGTIIPTYYFYVDAPNSVITERLKARGNESIITGKMDELNLLRCAYESFFTEFVEPKSLVRLDGTLNPLVNAGLIMGKILEAENGEDKYSRFEI